MTRTPQQAKAYITGASAWHTEVQWCGRYDPGREETNTILITTQSIRPEPPTKPTIFSNSSRVRFPLRTPRVTLRSNQSRNREAEG